MPKTPENILFSLNVCTINVNCQLKTHFQSKQSIDIKSVLMYPFNYRLKVINNNRIKFLTKILNDAEYDIIALQEMDNNTIRNIKVFLDTNAEIKYTFIYKTGREQTKTGLLIKIKKHSTVSDPKFNLYDTECRKDFQNKNIICTYKVNDLIIKVVNVHIPLHNIIVKQYKKKKYVTKPSFEIVSEKLKKLRSDCHLLLFLGDYNAYTNKQYIGIKDNSNDRFFENLRKYTIPNFKENDNSHTYFRNTDNTAKVKLDHIYWLKGDFFDQLDLSPEMTVSITEDINPSVNYCWNENISKNKSFNPEDKDPSFSGFTDHSMLMSELTIGSEQNNISEDVKEE